jgi:hypothetical protein
MISSVPLLDDLGCGEGRRATYLVGEPETPDAYEGHKSMAPEDVLLRLRQQPADHQDRVEHERNQAAEGRKDRLSSCDSSFANVGVRSKDVEGEGEAGEDHENVVEAEREDPGSMGSDQRRRGEMLLETEELERSGIPDLRSVVACLINHKSEEEEEGETSQTRSEGN